MATVDPLLKRFRAALENLYGDRLERVVLYGSRARGDDVRSDSDYDVAVFLKELHDRWAELDRLADLGTQFIEETGEVFNALPYDIAALQDRSPLMGEIRREGIDV